MKTFSHQQPGLDHDRKFLPCPGGLLLRVPRGFKEGRRVEHVHVKTHILDGDDDDERRRVHTRTRTPLQVL